MYDEIAAGYDELYGEEQLEKLEFAKSNFKIDGKILDIGCGTGISTKFFNCHTGLDPSQGLLNIASSKYNNIIFVFGYAEKIPFENDSFDYIISFTAAQNFSNLKEAVREFCRVAKKGFLITILKNSAKKDILRQELKHLNFVEKEDLKDTYFYVTFIK